MCQACAGQRGFGGEQPQKSLPLRSSQLWWGGQTITRINKLVMQCVRKVVVTARGEIRGAGGAMLNVMLGESPTEKVTFEPT